MFKGSKKRTYIISGQGLPTNMFVGITTNSVMWQLVKLTSVLAHVHVSDQPKSPNSLNHR